MRELVKASMTVIITTIKVTFWCTCSDLAVKGVNEPLSSVLSEVTGQWKNRSPALLSPSVAFCQQYDGTVSITTNMRIRFESHVMKAASSQDSHGERQLYTISNHFTALDTSQIRYLGRC